MISIALCTYNGEKYIGEQLQSIMQQTLQPDEIVICDDQSKDRTIDVIKNTLKYWNGNWRLIQNSKNLGYKKIFKRLLACVKVMSFFFATKMMYGNKEN